MLHFNNACIISIRAFYKAFFLAPHDNPLSVCEIFKKAKKKPNKKTIIDLSIRF